jgi:hypothetical protein
MRRKKESSFKDLLKWKREQTGHYILTGEYITGDREIFAEIKKYKSYWKYCLWTWGAKEPLALEFNWQKFKTAKDIKAAVIDLVTAGEPHAKIS